MEKKKTKHNTLKCGAFTLNAVSHIWACKELGAVTLKGVRVQITHGSNLRN